jgi:hypothetical protein
LFEFDLKLLDGSGFILFVVAMVVYTWEVHHLATAIANTVVAVVSAGTFTHLAIDILTVRGSPITFSS